MKKSLLILALLFLVSNHSFSQCLTTADFPFNTDDGAGASWSSGLYSPSQLGGAQTISQLSLKIANVFAGLFTYNNVKIYMRENSDGVFANGSYPAVSDFTQVYSGNMSFNGAGTYNFPLSSSFAYTGTKSLEVFFTYNPTGTRPDNEPVFTRTQQATGGPQIGKFGTGTSSGSRTSYHLIINNINCDFTALPVRLISFEAAREGSSTALRWATSSEENSSHFDIEHSRTGNTWTSMGSVKSKGSEAAKKTYSFPVTTGSGNNYFRLKMVDTDNTFSYSRIVQLNGEGSEKSFVFPNPVIDRIQLSDIELNGLHQITVQDVLGNVLFRSEKMDEGGIDANQFPAGMLIVKVTKTDGETSTYKIVKI